jgi:hypothetical protein
MSINTISTPQNSTPKRIIGVVLQRRLLTISASFRALLSHELQTGEAYLTHLSPRQAAALTATQMSDARVVARATPLESAALRAGKLPLGALRKAQRSTIDDGAIDRFIAKAGAGRVLDRLDHLTKPAATNGHANDNTNGRAIAPSSQLAL